MELSELRPQVETLLAKAESVPADCWVLSSEERSVLVSLAQVFALPLPGGDFQASPKALAFLRVARQAMRG
jgi:hypothetical protein